MFCSKKLSMKEKEEEIGYENVKTPKTTMRRPPSNPILSSSKRATPLNLFQACFKINTMIPKSSIFNKSIMIT